MCCIVYKKRPQAYFIPSVYHISFNISTALPEEIKCPRREAVGGGFAEMCSTHYRYLSANNLIFRIFAEIISFCTLFVSFMRKPSSESLNESGSLLLNHINRQTKFIHLPDRYRDIDLHRQTLLKHNRFPFFSQYN